MGIKQTEALKLALEALEYLQKPIAQGWDADEQLKKREQAITALKEALAEQQSGIKQVIDLYDSPEQPAYRAVKTWHDGKPVYVAEQPAQEQKPVPDWISYNKYTDELTISGRRYSAALFDERGF